MSSKPMPREAPVTRYVATILGGIALLFDTSLARRFSMQIRVLWAEFSYYRVNASCLYLPS